jgi:hypothetical protein
MKINLNELGKPKKLTIKDKVYLSIIIFTLFLTFNFPITISIMVVSILLIESFSKLIKKLLSGKSKIKWIFFGIIFLAIADTLLTYYMVLWKKVAYEFNPFVLIIWENFGVFFGEILRILIISFLLGISYFMLKKGNEKQVFASKVLFLFIFCIWFIVVCINLYQFLVFLL